MDITMPQIPNLGTQA